MSSVDSVGRTGTLFRMFHLVRCGKEQHLGARSILKIGSHPTSRVVAFSSVTVCFGVQAPRAIQWRRTGLPGVVAAPFWVVRHAGAPP